MVVTAPKFSFIQFANPDDCCCGIVLPASSVSDIAFYVYTDFRFKVGVKSEQTGNFVLDSFIYPNFGDWVDLSLDNKDLNDVFQCNECFRIVIVDENDAVQAESNLLQYICDTSYTSVIKYHLNEAGFGWGCPTGWNSVRLPIHLTNPQFPQEQEVYKRRNGSRKILFAEISKEYSLLIDYFPENIHHKLIIALSHDEVYVDDILLTKSDDYSVDWESVKTDDCGQYAPAACRMVENITAINSNCGDCNNARKYCTAEWIDFICQQVGEEFIPIYTTDEFLNINSISNPDNLPYVLMNDLDFEGSIINNIVITGNVYGQGFTIKNLTAYTTSVSRSAIRIMGNVYDILFDTITYIDNTPVRPSGDSHPSFLSSTAMIHNCHFRNGSFIAVDEGSISAGAFGGLTVQYCTVMSCNGQATYLAFYSTINNCHFKDNILNITHVNGQVCIARSFGINVIVENCITTAGVNNGLSELGYNGLNNCVVLNSSFNSTIENRGVIIANSVAAGNVNYSYNSLPINGDDNKDGIQITEQQAKSQAFYESLGYDFDGSTQEDGQAVWAMGADGYPKIIKPYKKFTGGGNTGNALAQSLIYRMYRGDVVVFEETKSILTDVSPVLTSEEYSQLANVQVEQRASDLLATLANKCADFEIINNVISERDENCKKEEQEDDFMIGQVIDFAGKIDKFDTTKWLICDGRTLNVADYQDLFDIIGTLYGGDGYTSFKLPPHNGRTSIGTGQASGLLSTDNNPNYTISAYGGQNEYKLTGRQMPIHSHFSKGTSGNAGNVSNYYHTSNMSDAGNRTLVSEDGVTVPTGAGGMVGWSGNNEVIENRSPFIVIHKLIRYKQ